MRHRRLACTLLATAGLALAAPARATDGPRFEPTSCDGLPDVADVLPACAAASCGCRATMRTRTGRPSASPSCGRQFLAARPARPRALRQRRSRCRADHPRRLPGAPSYGPRPRPRPGRPAWHRPVRAPPVSRPPGPPRRRQCSPWWPRRRPTPWRPTARPTRPARRAPGPRHRPGRLRHLGHGRGPGAGASRARGGALERGRRELRHHGGDDAAGAPPRGHPLGGSRQPRPARCLPRHPWSARMARARDAFLAACGTEPAAPRPTPTCPASTARRSRGWSGRRPDPAAAGAARARRPRAPHAVAVRGGGRTAGLLPVRPMPDSAPHLVAATRDGDLVPAASALAALLGEARCGAATRARSSGSSAATARAGASRRRRTPARSTSGCCRRACAPPGRPRGPSPRCRATRPCRCWSWPGSSTPTSPHGQGRRVAERIGLEGAPGAVRGARAQRAALQRLRPEAGGGVHRAARPGPRRGLRRDGPGPRPGGAVSRARVAPGGAVPMGNARARGGKPGLPPRVR